MFIKTKSQTCSTGHKECSSESFTGKFALNVKWNYVRKMEKSLRDKNIEKLEKKCQKKQKSPKNRKIFRKF